MKGVCIIIITITTINSSRFTVRVLVVVEVAAVVILAVDLVAIIA